MHLSRLFVRSLVLLTCVLWGHSFPCGANPLLKAIEGAIHAVALDDRTAFAEHLNRLDTIYKLDANSLNVSLKQSMTDAPRAPQNAQAMENLGRALSDLKTERVHLLEKLKNFRELIDTWRRGIRALNANPTPIPQVPQSMTPGTMMSLLVGDTLGVMNKIKTESKTAAEQMRSAILKAFFRIWNELVVPRQGEGEAIPGASHGVTSSMVSVLAERLAVFGTSIRRKAARAFTGSTNDQQYEEYGIDGSQHALLPSDYKPYPRQGEIRLENTGADLLEEGLPVFPKSPASLGQGKRTKDSALQGAGEAGEEDDEEVEECLPHPVQSDHVSAPYPGASRESSGATASGVPSVEGAGLSLPSHQPGGETSAGMSLEGPPTTAGAPVQSPAVSLEVSPQPWVGSALPETQVVETPAKGKSKKGKGKAS